MVKISGTKYSDHGENIRDKI